VNKIWKRKKIEEVANSISIVASLLGFAVLLPFLLNSLINTNDYPAAGKSLIGLVLAALWSLISVGYFVESNRGKGLFRLIIDALSQEKKENKDFIYSILRPPDGQKIIQILIKLSAIDAEVAPEEIKLIKEFADKWRIDIPNLQPGKPEEVTNLVDLKDLVQSYLDEKPDVEVAKGLRDIITLMTETDDKVTLEEAMAVAEFSGMIGNYVNAEKDRKVDMFEVNIVPQGEKQLRAIKELLPNLIRYKIEEVKYLRLEIFFQKNTQMRSVKNILILGFILPLYE
jgi:hypothetical protein